jgi:hypothetical protein
MAIARVVTFEGVDPGRVEEMQRSMNAGEKPDGLPATELMLLHDADAGTAVVLVFFDSEEDYRAGDAFLAAMPADATPGRRASVGKYEVAVRVTG